MLLQSQPYWHTKTYKTNNGILDLVVCFLSVLIKISWKLLASATVFQLMTDGTKLDNGFIELIDHAITHYYPILEFLSTFDQHL